MCAEMRTQEKEIKKNRQTAKKVLTFRKWFGILTKLSDRKGW